MIDLTRRGFVGAAAALAATPALARTAPKAAITNPLVKNRADAQVFRHADGNYYMTGSVPEYDRLVLRRSKTIAGLATAQERVLWRHLAKGLIIVEARLAQAGKKVRFGLLQIRGHVRNALRLVIGDRESGPLCQELSLLRLRLRLVALLGIGRREIGVRRP